MPAQDIIQTDALRNGSVKSLTRAISLVSNEHPGWEELVNKLPAGNMPVIGITGPPGAGKSTLTDGLIAAFVKQGKKIAVLCVDPSSPFTKGAILGDRIRMSAWHNHPQVFIRSLATRGSLGGLPPMVKPIIRLIRAAPFDYLFIETVGVGQSEVEIAALANLTIVVLVPESGDDIQIMKAGVMEIADFFVVNKSDRPGVDAFVHDLQTMLRHPGAHQKQGRQVFKTTASTKQGVEELAEAIRKYFL